MLKKNTTTVSAKDMLISLANKLPENLLLDAVNEHGLFCMEFLLWLNECQLSALREEAKKHADEDIFLFFYSIPENNSGKKVPVEVKNLSSFDFSKVLSINFNGNTLPALKHSMLPPVYYVSVTFVLKE